jgi:methionyl-tRNA synthetase
VIYCCANICRVLAVTMAPFLPGSSMRIASLLDLEGGLSWEGELSFSLETVKMTAKPEILFKKIDDKEVARLKSTVTKSSDASEFFKS